MENYPQGLLQGNASGSEIWTVLSSIILKILDKWEFTVELCSILFKKALMLVELSYVDDYNLVQPGEYPIDVLSSIQKSINSWGSLIQIICGALSIEKIWWYPV